MTVDAEVEAEVQHGPSASPARVLLRRALRIAWLVVLFAWLALALRDRWAEVRTELADLHSLPLAAAMVVSLLGVGASAGIWHQMLRGIGEALPLRVSLRVFFVGQVGKYLPGAVWPVVTQAALAREHGVAPRATVSAATLFMWVHLVTGAGVAALLLGSTGRLPLATVLAVPLLGLLLLPRPLGWTLQTLFRVARRRPLRQVPDGSHMARGAAWALVMWLCYGAHLQLLTVATGDAVDIVTAAGTFAAGWVAGFVLLIAPAGVGPREAAIVALLPLTAGAGLVVALVSRLMMTVADGVWAVVTALDVRRLARRADRIV